MFLLIFSYQPCVAYTITSHITKWSSNNFVIFPTIESVFSDSSSYRPLITTLSFLLSISYLYLMREEEREIFLSSLEVIIWPMICMYLSNVCTVVKKHVFYALEYFGVFYVLELPTFKFSRIPRILKIWRCHGDFRLRWEYRVGRIK